MSNPLEFSPLSSENMYGSAQIHPQDNVTAGSWGTWTIIYTVGFHGIDDGGSLMVVIRHASDWGEPQTSNAIAPNYVTAVTNGEAKLRVHFDPKAHVRPWRRGLVVDVYDGSLKAGDTITITYGDTSGGSPGSQAQTFQEDTFEFRVLVDPFGTGLFVPVPHPLTLQVVGGPAEKLVLIAPSQVVAGEPFALVLRAQDRWYNPSPNYRGLVSFTSSDPLAHLPTHYTFTAQDGGVHRFSGVTLYRPSNHQIVVSDAHTGLQAVSNPIICFAQPPTLRLFWGDIHGQTETSVGTGTVEQYFAYARDAAAVDFAAHAANDFQITKEHYADTQRRVKEFHQPGKFVTFLAYEWSGNTPAGGDHNVYFLGDDEPIHRSGHWLLEDKTDEDTDRYPISRLFDTFRGRKDVMIIPHIGGRRANLNFYGPEFSPLIEISSVHGRFEWFAREALQRGLKVGFIASSDDHTGHPGAPGPSSLSLSLRGGLMAAYASELTRQSLWEAFWQRHCYATTGERIILAVRIGEHMMGDEMVTDAPPHISVTVGGTAALDKVELIRGVDTIYSHPLLDAKGFVPRQLRIVWSGARGKGRHRWTDWDGELSLDKGKLVAAKEVAFDNPKEGITEFTERSVRWHSRTSGDPDGIIVEYEAPDDATVTFNAGPARFSFNVGDISEPLVVECGGLEQKVAISRVAAGEMPIAVEFDYVDHTIKPGMNPYWLRVTQQDGEMAWSSPILVEYRKR